MLFEDSAVALIHDHLARLVGFGAAASLGDGLLLPTELGGSFRTSLLDDDPASFRLMHSINVASQHHGLRLELESARQRGAGARRSLEWSGAALPRPEQKETGTGLGRSRMKYAGGK